MQPLQDTEATKMSTQEQLVIPGANLASRLEAVMESLPKEGYKAAVAVGIVDRALTILNEVRDLATKIICVSQHKGGCKGGYCDSKCGGLFLEKVGDEVIVAKYGSNPFSAKLAPGKLEMGVKNARMVLEGSTLKVGVQGGEGYVWTTIDLTDANEIFENSYTIKYVLRKVGGPLIKARIALKYCMALSAITC